MSYSFLTQCSFTIQPFEKFAEIFHVKDVKLASFPFQLFHLFEPAPVDVLSIFNVSTQASDKFLLLFLDEFSVTFSFIVVV